MGERLFMAAAVALFAGCVIAYIVLVIAYSGVV